MTIYKETYRKNRFAAPPYLGYTGRQEQRPYNRINKLPAMHLLRSPTPFVSSSLVVVPEAVRLVDDYRGCFAMEQDVPTALRAINESKLACIVRRSLKREDFHIQGWKVRKLDGGIGNPVSLGLFRYEGVGVDHDEWLDWSIILKVIQSLKNSRWLAYFDDQS